MLGKRLIVIVLLLAAVLLYWGLDLEQYLNLATLKSRHEEFVALYEANPLLIAGAFFLFYVAVTGASLPGAVLLTLAAGALFGLWWGTLLVSFASSIGATLAFLVARWLLRDSIRQRLGERFRRIDQGIEREGSFYLFSLRLVPVVPFFVINLAAGLTSLSVWRFYWVSQLGMLAGTAVYVNAGTQLMHIDSLQGIFSPGVLGAFLLLAFFPWLARWLLRLLQRRRLYRGWQKPRQFDRNLIVIGAGSAGLVTAYIAAAAKARVTLVEKDAMGGDCLNTGCVPSKTLIKSARVAQQSRHWERFGLQGEAATADFGAVMRRVQKVIAKIAPHDSVERYTGLGVECLRGHARLVSPWEVAVSTDDGDEQRLSARSIVIATGAGPAIPPIEGLEQIDYLTTETVWQLRQAPISLLVLGGGPIGCELAQSLARLGVAVTLLEALPQILPKEDPEIAEQVRDSLAEDGVAVYTGQKAVRFSSAEHGVSIQTEGEAGSLSFAVEQVLVAVGRRAHTRELGLEDLGIAVRDNGTVETNEYLQATLPNVYACGDVAGPFQFTHTASHQAWYAAVNALLGGLWRFKADYSVIPWATFTDPEVARVGLSETEARQRGIDFEVTRFELNDHDRAITDGVARGLVKLITAGGSDRILGVTIIGEHAGDLIAEYVLAMKHGLGLNKLLGTIHIYPTLAEANKLAAGQWRRAHTPQKLLAWVERWHTWRRG